MCMNWWMVFSLFLFQTQQTNMPKKKKCFSLLFVEMLHKFTNDRISEKMTMMHIWIGFKTKLKRTTEDLFKGKTRNFSFLFCPFSSLNKIDTKETNTSWNDLRKQRDIFSSVTLKEGHRIRFHSILIENNTISSFSCSFISSNLLFPLFHSENDTMHQEEWMLFQTVMKRKYFTKKEAEFPYLERIRYFLLSSLLNTLFFSFLLHIHW